MWGTILQIIFPIIDMFWKAWAKTEERKKEYVNFLTIMARKGVQSASNRLAAQEQIDAVKELWKKRDDKSQNP